MKRSLSPRQTEVIKAVAHGATDKEVADKLKLSTVTVGHYMQIILAKLGARSRAHAVFLWALRK